MSDPMEVKSDEDGNVPAIEYSRASIARDIISQRMALSLAPAELARLARVRLATLARVESGTHTAAMRTYDRIFKALDAVRPGGRRVARG